MGKMRGMRGMRKIRMIRIVRGIRGVKGVRGIILITALMMKMPFELFMKFRINKSRWLLRKVEKVENFLILAGCFACRDASLSPTKRRTPFSRIQRS